MHAFLRLSLACCFALSTACGSIANQTDAGSGGDDASGGDGGGNVADAAPDAATFGMVTVNVFAGGNPAPNVAVMYHKADGSYIGSMLTDTNGQVVIADMPVGGAVTAPVNPYGNMPSSTQHFLTSVTGVQIGDVINIGKSQSNSSGTNVGTVSVTMPPAFAGATSYRVLVGCSSSTTANASATLKPVIKSNCVPASNAVDVIAYALDASGNRLGYSAAASVALSGAAPNLTGSINMPAWQTGLAMYTLQLSNAPADFSVNGVFLGYKQDVQVDTLNPSAVDVTSGNGTSFPFLIVPGFYQNTTVGLIANISRTSLSTLAKRADLSPTASQPAQLSWDLSTDMLQPPATVTGTPDTATTIAWTGGSTSCADNPTPDELLYLFQGASSTDTYAWYGITPGTQASPLELPQLDPAVAQALWPTATFTTSSAAIVTKSDSALTYDDFRLSDDNLTVATTLPDAAATRCLSIGVSQ